MFLHTVLFWLREDLNADELQKFEAGLRALTEIQSVKFSFIGKPASTRRPVIDWSYSYKLVVGFDDLAGHDFYQEAPAHLEFISDCREFWTKVQIYDAE
ncbi:MAG: Dabb family protein [Planctomycetaceae bacterium]|nr:Dabb family protein [Planctomycetaceae bacterium]